jgi:hypothetical protein
MNKAIGSAFGETEGHSQSTSQSGPPPSSSSPSEITANESGPPNYEQMFSSLGNMKPTIVELLSSETFVVTYPVANGENLAMHVKVKGLKADPSTAFGGLDGNGKKIDYFDPKSWDVSGGLESIELYKGSAQTMSVSVTNTAMQIKGGPKFDTDFENKDVGALSLQGNFSKTNADDFFAILDQLSVNPNATPSASPSGDPFASSYTTSSSSPSSSSTSSNGGSSTSSSGGSSTSSSGGSSTSSSSSSSSSSGISHSHSESSTFNANYTIDKVLVYEKDSSKTNGLSDNPVAQSEMAKGSLSLSLGDYTMSIVSQQLPDYITAGDLFDFASVDLLDVEEIIKDGVDGLFTLNHKTHGDIVIIESDMSSATGTSPIIGTGDTFGTYQGQRFVSDSNDVVAAYFDFGNVAITDAQFETYWDSIDGITDMFTEIV